MKPDGWFLYSLKNAIPRDVAYWCYEQFGDVYVIEENVIRRLSLKTSLDGNGQ